MTPSDVQGSAVFAVLQAYGLEKAAGFIGATAKRRTPLSAVAAVLSAMSSPVESASGSMQYANPVQQARAIMSPSIPVPVHSKNQQAPLNLARIWREFQGDELVDKTQLLNRRAALSRAFPKTTA